MANVIVEKKQFERYIGKLTAELQDKMTMLGLPIEIQENQVNIEVFANRPDLLSFQGIARAINSFIKNKHKKYKVNKGQVNYRVIIDSSVKEVRPFTACAIVKNIKFSDEKIKEVIDIQEKLHLTFGRNRRKIAIGIYPLEKITLPIYYKASSPEQIKFIPLDMQEELTGREILQKHPAGREYAHLLEDKKKFPYFIDKARNILSMPPIINSQLTGKITEKTRDVFIECSGFDFEILSKTLNILVTALADMGGQIYSMKLKYKNKIEITPNLEPEKIKINPENINKLLGLNLREVEIKNLLKKMGHDYRNKTVYYPAYRTDILHEVDIAEEIAIAYGYDKFQAEIPEISTIGEEDEKEIKKRKIAEILTGLGLLEVSSYSLINKEDYEKLKLKPAVIEVEAAKTENNCLRNNLLVSVCKILSENVDSEYPQKIFEIGKTFTEDETEETGIKEHEKLLIALTSANFTDIKQVLDYLTRMLNKEYKIQETSHISFIEGRVGEIVIKGKNIGILGEIHPEILRNWHLKMPLSVLEVEIDELIN